jgi:hypothetical protein
MKIPRKERPMRIRYDEDTGEKAYPAWKECGHSLVDVYATAPAVVEEFARFIRATETFDTGLINQVLRHIDRDKTPMILRKRMCTLPPLMALHKRHNEGHLQVAEEGQLRRPFEEVRRVRELRDNPLFTPGLRICENVGTEIPGRCFPGTDMDGFVRVAAFSRGDP